MRIKMPAINKNADLVTFSVKINGKEVHRDYRILTVEVWRQVNRIPGAKLTIADGDPAAQNFSAGSSGHFIPGNVIEIFAGYHSEEKLLFKGIIIKHNIRVIENKAPTLIVECRDIVFKLSIDRKNRAFTEISDSEAIAEILEINGLENDIDQTDGAHEKLIQYNTTDWDFINLRAEINGMFVIADDGTLKVKRIGFPNTAEREITYGVDLLEIEAEIDARTQFNGFSAESWDSATQQIIEATNNHTAEKLPGKLTPEELAAATGVDLQALRHGGQISENEMITWSNAMLLRSRLAINIGRIAIQGDADLRPGSTVALQGLSSLFTANVPVTGIRHDIAGGIWTTHLSYGLKFETFAQSFRNSLQDTSASGIIPSVYGLQPGVVVQLENDPKGEHRIKVNLPAIDMKDEGIWARIALPYAGKDSGFRFLPEIGDEVVVGFMHDDPRNPVIIGMMHSSAIEPAVENSDSNHLKALQTRSGIKIAFDDENTAMEISTPSGNLFKMDEAGNKFLMEDKNGNRILMDTDGISISSSKDIVIKAGSGDITVEGINLEQKSAAGMKLSGEAGIEASSSAIVEIKGSLVKIN